LTYVKGLGRLLAIDRHMKKYSQYLAAIAVVIAGSTLPWLAAAQTPQKYAAGLADIMSAIQFRHSKLWTAGQKQNWELAGYELGLVKAGLAEAISLYNDIPVENIAMIDTPLASLDKAISARNGGEFNKAFNELTVGCNACHQSIGRGFIAMTVPASSPFSNQSFSPHQGK
jgi:hypothetical protein